MMPAVLKRIEAARAQGLDVIADVYPWTASSNSLHATLPYWARGGSREEMVARLKDPANREKVRAELAKDSAWALENGPARILIADTLDPALARYEGKTLDEVAKAEGKHPADALMDLVIADKGNTVEDHLQHERGRRARGGAAPAGLVLHRLRRVGHRRHLLEGAQPPARLGLDAAHPRPLRARGEAAVARGGDPQDDLAAGDAHAAGRTAGRCATGFFADLVAFDPETIVDRSTYVHPWQYSAGIPYVSVNGQLVVDGGAITDARPGRILRGPGHKSPR